MSSIEGESQFQNSEEKEKQVEILNLQKAGDQEAAALLPAVKAKSPERKLMNPFIAAAVMGFAAITGAVGCSANGKGGVYENDHRSHGGGYLVTQNQSVNEAAHNIFGQILRAGEYAEADANYRSSKAHGHNTNGQIGVGVNNGSVQAQVRLEKSDTNAREGKSMSDLVDPPKHKK
jgi:hypothetical protein